MKQAIVNVIAIKEVRLIQEIRIQETRIMVDYKCGHKTSGVIILDSNELSMAAYLNWVDTVGMNGTKEICFTCYCSQNTSKVTK